MSAWYLFSALGFYPVAPGSGWYELGSPAVRAADVRVGQGRNLCIRTEGNAPSHARVDRIEWNGAPLQGHRIAAAQLLQGGTLTFHFATDA